MFDLTGNILGSDYWTNLMKIVIAFAVLAFIIERALYQIFDSKAWQSFENYIDKKFSKDALDLKPWISVIMSLFVVFQTNLDMIAVLFAKDPTWSTLIITGLFLSGGSTGVYKFLKQLRQLKSHKIEKIKKENGN